MKKITTLTVAALLAAGLLTGCTETTGDGDAEDNETSSATEAALPGGLFADSEPADVSALAAAKEGAAVGDRVTFEARIGGRKAPFVENRAVFFVADTSILTCDELHGDTCPTPWDYCCEPADNLLAHMATVQVVDADGRPIKHSLQSEHGLEPAATIVVTGTVDSIDDAGNFVVNAESIFIKS